MRFDGDDYLPPRDNPRLSSQHDRLRAFMSDGGWHTLKDISHGTGDPEASMSAQLRHLRKPRFGGHAVDRRYVGSGLYEYRVPTLGVFRLEG
jgi:hypothetical protein